MNFLVIVLLFVVFLQTRIMDLRRAIICLSVQSAVIALFPVLRMARVFIFMLRDC